MPKHKDLKRLIRARMQKTGESYTTARIHLLSKSLPLPRDYSKVAGMSDAAVKKATGKTWHEWARHLDEADAATLEHRGIVALAARELGEEAGWWAQMVTVAYERFRGLREVGQRRGGGYDVNKSKTLPVSEDTLWSSLIDAKRRKRWLPDIALEPTKAKWTKTARGCMDDGTKVSVYLTAKEDEKTTLTIQQSGLPDKDAAARAKAFWSERLDTLKRMLAD